MSSILDLLADKAVSAFEEESNLRLLEQSITADPKEMKSLDLANFVTQLMRAVAKAALYASLTSERGAFTASDKELIVPLSVGGYAVEELDKWTKEIAASHGLNIDDVRDEAESVFHLSLLLIGMAHTKATHNLGLPSSMNGELLWLAEAYQHMARAMDEHWNRIRWYPKVR